jgi:PAS domain S-box-containing protein
MEPGQDLNLAALRLAAIVESSDDAIVAKDLNGIVTSWNIAAERIFGYTAEEMVGQSITRIIPKERQSEENEVLRRIRANERVEHFETVRQRKDGSFIDVSLTVSPIRSPNGVIVGASKIARDISERKRAEAALADLKHRLMTLVYASSRVLRSPTVDDVQTATIETAQQLIAADGYALWRTDPSSGTWRLATSQGISEMFIDRLLDPATAGDPADASMGAVAIENVIMEPTLAPHRDAYVAEGVLSMLAVALIVRGKRAGTLTFYYRKPHEFSPVEIQTAEALANFAAAALTTADAYRQATDANRLKDEFLATLSHELRTPLNAVMGYTKMLSMNVLDEAKRANAVKVIDRNASSLKQIIDDVLDVSRIVSGKLRLNVQPLNLGDVVKMSLATVLPAADAKGIVIDSHLEPGLPPVSGDIDRLQQVVWNLISNAVKFTPHGGRIDVDVEQTDGHVAIVVKDTGRGIAKEFLPHLFERFRQADSAFSREHGGLGLGLAIVRELVELHGGTVRARSEGPGSGSTFRVELPILTIRSSRSSARDGAADHAFDHVAAGARRVDGVKVLAVDDERDARGLLREILEAAGAEVWTAGSAKQALTVLAHFAPDVIIADIGMPEIDGHEFIKMVRKDLTESIRDVPAAALTAYARTQDRATALASGFQMHITKPVDPVELVIAVSTLAERPDVTPA